MTGRRALTLLVLLAALLAGSQARAQQCGVESAVPAARPPRPAGAARDGLLALSVVAIGVAGVLAARGRVRLPKLSTLAGTSWSPYLAGAGLGVVATLALALEGRPLGASGAFAGLAGALGRWLAPGSDYFRHLTPPVLGFDTWLLLGVVGGAAVGAALQGELRVRWLPETAWRERFGGGIARRWVLVFLGTGLVGFGAGLAGGCTSGLAISQGALLSPGAFVFMAAMFASGAPVALWTGRRR